MKTLYLDCPMGAAGDMLSAALLELYPDKDAFAKRMNELLDGRAVYSYSTDRKCGICGIHVSVKVNGHEEDEHMHDAHEAEKHEHMHQHNSIDDILAFIERAELPDKVRKDATNVYRMIAEAEAHVHGCDMEHIHFHELGTADALADVLSVCLLIYLLAPERILASPVNVGGGTVKCAHGILPVPAPATEYLLRGIPVYSGDIKTELCTPTGAALLKYFVSEFTALPVMQIERAGYGTGTKDFKTLNAVRALLGEGSAEEESVLELSCNIDDMCGEELGFAMEELLTAGVLDAFFTPIIMKKSRPATMLTCLCKPSQREEIIKCIFKNTSTLGIREKTCKRAVLNRELCVKDTQYGKLTLKLSNGYGVERIKPEYEELAHIARENGMSLLELKGKLRATPHSELCGIASNYE